MLAQQNEYIKDASDTIYQLSYEDAIRQQCEAKEDFYRRQRTREKYLQEAQNLANEVQQENILLKNIISEKDVETARLKALLAPK